MNRKKFFLLLLLLLVAALVIWGSLRSQEGGLTNFQRWQTEITCRTLAARYEGERDAMEDSLAEAGYPVVDTQDPYPSYLSNSEGLTEFWQKVKAGKNASQKVFQVSEAGNLSCMVFRFKNGQPWFSHWSGPGQWEERPILDWTMTDTGTFYYQLYPRDIHYITYAAISIKPPDRELYDMTQRFILPVCYQAVNLFLVDWKEGDWGSLSFNDLLEYLYYQETGEKFQPNIYPFHQSSPPYLEIPAKLFEDTVLPYFDISREDLRALGRFDPEKNCYPWVVYDLNDRMWFPHMEPSVTNCVENPDGTLTLTVAVASRDMKTDRFFVHEATVRPLKDGRFQYVSNRVVEISDYGLPFAVPRLDWNDT